jgi:hypothetical protein
MKTILICVSHELAAVLTHFCNAVGATARISMFRGDGPCRDH